jgi:manganese efflux pump family protein
MWEALALAFALAMDATAVSAARGVGRPRRADVVILPLLFGGFQGGMAALGWLVGEWGGEYVTAWDHWIAFVLLVVIGGRMAIAALRGGEEGAAQREGALVYLGLAIATSIDAAGAGVTLPLLEIEPWSAIVLIGGVTAVCSLAGYQLARQFGSRWGARLELLGGLVLIGLGIKILVTNL